MRRPEQYFDGAGLSRVLPLQSATCIFFNLSDGCVVIKAVTVLGNLKWKM